MHENQRYVKLACACLTTACALVWPAGAGAELVASSADGGALGVGADGSPRVAYLQGCALTVATRTAAGWRSRLASRCVPGDARTIDALVVDHHGNATVLLQSTHVLVLVGSRTRVIARARRGHQLGAAGITADAGGVPVVAYVLWKRSGATFLRLVRAGRTIGITHKGFPQSDAPPSAAPVLVRGRMHVIETFGAQGIGWERHGRRWVGQYLFANITGANGGPVFAAARAGTTFVASTLLEPQFGERDVLVTSASSSENTDTVFTNAFAAGLIVMPTGPEVAANEPVDEFDVAALIGDDEGRSTELDGAILGYAAFGGMREVLLRMEDGLQWFTSPAPFSVHVMLTVDANGNLSGTVIGAVGGEVEIDRERQGAPRELVAAVPLDPTGAFSAHDSPPTSPTLYRAVYRDPATGIPYASLTRTPVGGG